MGQSSTKCKDIPFFCLQILLTITIISISLGLYCKKLQYSIISWNTKFFCTRRGSCDWNKYPQYFVYYHSPFSLSTYTHTYPDVCIIYRSDSCSFSSSLNVVGWMEMEHHTIHGISINEVSGSPEDTTVSIFVTGFFVFV